MYNVAQKYILIETVIIINISYKNIVEIRTVHLGRVTSLVEIGLVDRQDTGASAARTITS